MGYVGRRRFPIDPRPVTRLALYILSPCLVFSLIVHSEVSATDSLELALVAAGSIALTAGVGTLGASMRRLDARGRSTHLLASMFPNGGTSFFSSAWSCMASKPRNIARDALHFSKEVSLVRSANFWSCRRDKSSRAQDQLYAMLSFLIE